MERPRADDICRPNRAYVDATASGDRATEGALPPRFQKDVTRWLMIPTDPQRPSDEPEAVVERYLRRNASVPKDLYSPRNPSELLTQQEKDRALVRLIRDVGLEPVSERRVLEIGCGTGSNLLKLIELGFSPENLVGNELLETRAAIAGRRLAPDVRLLVGDASRLALDPASFDIVYQSTVFTSILDDAFQETLALRMWDWVRPGGGVLWYDFVFDNPRNPDVRGIPLRRVRKLFPTASIHCWSITLAPPISRLVTRLHPALYGFFNLLPFLRTHLLCWIAKK